MSRRVPGPTGECHRSCQGLLYPERKGKHPGDAASRQMCKIRFFSPKRTREPSAMRSANVARHPVAAVEARGDVPIVGHR